MLKLKVVLCFSCVALLSQQRAAADKATNNYLCDNAIDIHLGPVTTLQNVHFETTLHNIY